MVDAVTILSRPDTNSVDDVILPLVPIERFFLRHDRAKHPMVFRVLLQFEGPVHRELLSTAFQWAIKRQPLLTSTVVGEGRHRSWQRSATLPQLHWQPAGASPGQILQSPIEPISLSGHPGIRGRVWTIHTEAGIGLMVLLDLHHACCDGQGARQFLFEWFAAYERLARGEPLTSPPWNTVRLNERGNYRTMTPPIGTWEGLRNLYSTVRGRTARLPERFPETPGKELICERVLSTAETSQLRRFTEKRRLRINDVGLSAAFAAFANTFPECARRNWITLLHPVDLRWPSDLRTPACNRVGVAFLRRRESACRDPQQLLRGLQEEMNYIKQRYVGAEFLRGLAAVERAPRIQDWIERRGWFGPTLQYTCLGNTTRLLPRELVQEDRSIHVAGLRLCHISGFMQRGPRLPISLTACETNHRLSLTARICLRTLDTETSLRFFDCFVEKLLQAGGDS